MKILAADCSATSASCCVYDGDKIIASSFINVKLTHSQTLLPMIEDMLENSCLKLSEIDCFAISKGPGSFTGVRIGISAIKGLAAVKDKDCIGVSTLEAIAYNYPCDSGIVCAVMDARCNQVYNALFRIGKGEIIRLCDDRALFCEDLYNELCEKYPNEKITVAGDGTAVFMPFVKSENIQAADITHRYQNGVGVALAAYKKYENNEVIKPDELLPFYLRLPQAERELKQRQSGNNKDTAVHLQRYK